jgi:hypothetical protein
LCRLGRELDEESDEDPSNRRFRAAPGDEYVYFWPVGGTS